MHALPAGAAAAAVEEEEEDEEEGVSTCGRALKRQWHTKGREEGVTRLQTPAKKLKGGGEGKDFVHIMVSNIFHNLPFSHNQLMTSTSKFYKIKYTLECLR